MPTPSTKPKNFTFYTVGSGQSAVITGNSSTLYGGNDTLISAGNNNVLIAGSSSSTLVASTIPGSFTSLIGNGSSSLVAGNGNDYISLNGQGDQISGVSGGIDTIATSSNNISLLDTLTYGSGITNVANLIFTGTTSGATLSGNSLSGSLIGSKFYGNQIIAGTGAETLVGGSGNDCLVGNGRSVLIGNGGNDTYVINQSGDKILQTNLGGTVQTALRKFDLSNTAQNGPGVAKVTGVVFSENGTVTSGVVTLTGNSLNDTIVGVLSAGVITTP
jgi:Ca2+-binding RTX toxin-like protein